MGKGDMGPFALWVFRESVGSALYVGATLVGHINLVLAQVSEGSQVDCIPMFSIWHSDNKRNREQARQPVNFCQCCFLQDANHGLTIALQ